MTMLRLWIDGGFPHQGTTCRWWHYAADGRQVAQGRSEPRHWPGREGGAAPACEVLLSAQQATGLRIVLPAARGSADGGVVRYAVEEQLLDDAERMHLSIGPRRADGRHEVVAIDRARLTAILEALRQLGLAPSRVVVAAQALPREGHAVLLADGAATLVTPETWLPLDDAGDGPPPMWRWFATAQPDTACTVHALSGTAADATRYAARLGAGARAAVAIDPAQLCADGLNLLQGEFADRRGRSQALRMVRPLAWLAAAALLLVFLGGVGRWLGLRHEVAELREQQAALAKAALPGVSVIVAPALQMQRAADARRQARGELGEGDALPLLAHAVAAGIGPLDALRYRDGRLELTCITADDAALARLRTELAARGIGSSVRSTEPAGGGRRTTLVLVAGAMS